MKLEWLKAHQLEAPSDFANECSNDSFVGFVLNTAVVDDNFVKRIVLPKYRRHWFAIVKFPTEQQDTSGSFAGQTWIVLDSKSIDSLQLISISDLIIFLSDKISTGCTVLKATRIT